MSAHPVPNAAAPDAPSPLDAIYSKISWKIIPILLVCYVIAFLDRINIGYAQLQMRETLELSAAAYALGAGIFFLGYFLFEVPSNLMLEKIGARKTLLRIMFCWGIVASLMMFVTTPTQFYILRFLLGAFEAGFFPGVILYLTYWYPSAKRGQMISVFMTASVFANVIAGPVSGGIMKYMDGLNGWHGWQWLFLTQGLPASFLGIAAFLILKDKPEDAPWLSTDEKRMLRERLDQDSSAVQGASHGSLWQLIRDPKVYGLALVYFLLLGATYTIVFWLPTLVRSWGIQDLFIVGLIAAIPSVVGIFGMVLIGRSSDRHQERRWHYVACVAVAALGLGIMTQTQGTLLPSLTGMIIAMVGISAATPLFFTATSEYLPKATAAAGIALVSSLGNLGPAVSPSINNAVTAATGSPVYGLMLVMAMYIVSGLILAVMMRPAATLAARQQAPASA